MKQVVEGKLYNTETAQLLAHDRYHDGHNWDRQGRNQYVYKTKKGNFFLLYTTIWQGERDHIAPVSRKRAMESYEQLPEHEVEWAEAFDEEPVEA